jgi:branched-chain amino acid transport system substrate-binding protein
MPNHAQQGYNPQYFGLGLEVTNSLASDPHLQGMFVPQQTFPWMANDVPGEAAYHAAMQQYDPSLPGASVTSSVWVAGMLLQKAAANLPANNPGPSDIFKGVWAIKNETLGGLVPPFSFTQGQPVAEQPCFFVVQIQGGKFTAPNGSKLSCP